VLYQAEPHSDAIIFGGRDKAPASGSRAFTPGPGFCKGQKRVTAGCWPGFNSAQFERQSDTIQEVIGDEMGRNICNFRCAGAVGLHRDGAI
jgi:hypothetical protein